MRSAVKNYLEVKDKLAPHIQEAPRVVRQGNALYVCIPKGIARLLGIRVGDRLAMIVEGSVIRMSRFNLNEVIGVMLARRPERG
jgi:antitoxin component of MazEF toxin-antitoxin module